MNPSRPVDPEPTVVGNRSVVPPHLMRLEDRIVLEASGLADGDSALPQADQAPDHPENGTVPSPNDADAHADGAANGEPASEDPMVHI